METNLLKYRMIIRSRCSIKKSRSSSYSGHLKNNHELHALFPCSVSGIRETLQNQNTDRGDQMVAE